MAILTPSPSGPAPTTVMPGDARYIRQRTFVLTRPEFVAPTAYDVRVRVTAVALAEPTVVEGRIGISRGDTGDYLVEFPSGDMWICPRALFEAISAPSVAQNEPEPEPEPEPEAAAPEAGTTS